MVSRLDCLSGVRLPLAAHESPCVRLQRVVRLRRSQKLRLPVLPVGNTRVRAVGETFPFSSFVPNSGAFPPDQRDFHPQYHSTSPLRTLSPIFLSKIFAKMTDFYPYYSALATIWGVRRRAELQYRKIHGNGGHPLCVCRILEPEIRGQFRFWFRLRRTQERRPATSRAH